VERPAGKSHAARPAAARKARRLLVGCKARAMPRRPATHNHMHTELLDGSDRWVHDDLLCARLAALHVVPCDGVAPMRLGL